MVMRTHMLTVGVVGPVSDESNHDLLWQRLTQAFEDVKMNHMDRPIAIVGFGIDRGLPGLAYHLAVQYEWQTYSIVFPDSPRHPRFLVDQELFVNPRPDSVRRFYFEACEVIIRIGGSDELRTAVLDFSMQSGHRVYEYEL